LLRLAAIRNVSHDQAFFAELIGFVRVASVAAALTAHKCAHSFWLGWYSPALPRSPHPRNDAPGPAGRN
jgi:hypothetical protein